MSRKRKGWRTTTCKDTGEVCYSYSDYLKSDHWRLLKARYWKSKMPKVCGRCGSRAGPYDMHHKTYKRMGREHLKDITPLCRGCHQATHEVLKVNENSRINCWNAHKH